MSDMSEMSRAVRFQLGRHGKTLEDIPADVLRDYELILTALTLDIRNELKRREHESNVRDPD